jgi:hypothetical protein
MLHTKNPHPLGQSDLGSIALARVKEAFVAGGLQSFTEQTGASHAGAALAWPMRASNRIVEVRAARRAEKIRARLRGTAADRVKTRGTHWRSYRRLCEEAKHAEAAAESWLLESLERAAKHLNDSAPAPQGRRRRSPP